MNNMATLFAVVGLAAVYVLAAPTIEKGDGELRALDQTPLNLQDYIENPELDQNNDNGTQLIEDLNEDNGAQLIEDQNDDNGTQLIEDQNDDNGTQLIEDDDSTLTEEDENKSSEEELVTETGVLQTCSPADPDVGVQPTTGGRGRGLSTRCETGSSLSLRHCSRNQIISFLQRRKRQANHRGYSGFSQNFYL